jgi:SAM-dependent methyltransferase
VSEAGRHGTAERQGLGLSPREIALWPGSERRKPSRSDPHYLVCAPLARQLREGLARHLADRDDIRVLDVGCGAKPYLPFVAHRAVTYRGLDAMPGIHVDDVGSAESLPYSDDSFDVVFCTQVLEHLEDPTAAVAEMSRVLAPGGVAFVSTHGVFLFHPAPAHSDRDYWRWTHAGLGKLFREAGDWDDIQVQPNGNLVACVAYLLCQFLGRPLPGKPIRGRIRRLGRASLNSMASFLDKRYPPRARVPHEGSLSANYLVTAIKASG